MNAEESTTKTIVHYHTLVIANCERDPHADDLGDALKRFIRDFIQAVDMHVLIDPQVQLGPYGFTGIAGIVTSHIAFHYFADSRTLQFDLYSCRHYKLARVMEGLHKFWYIKRADVLFIKRGRRFVSQHYRYDRNALRLLKHLTK